MTDAFALPAKNGTLLSDIETAISRMGSRDLYVEIARSFAETLPATEKAIADALEQGAWPESRRLAHSLKSNCAAMGAEELRERVYSLEKACAEGDVNSAYSLFTPIRSDLRSLRDELLAL